MNHGQELLRPLSDIGPAITLDGLSVRYGRKTALDQVTLTVPKGAVYALLGRNGAGKSSAVRCLLGLQKPTAGRALLFGHDVWRERARAMARVGVVPEEPDVPPEMNAIALARFCRSFYARWDQEGALARLGRFGVPLRTPCGRLSKGQKAQVQLALALGSLPELLVLDDPTLGLDVVARRDFFSELISDLADRGTTVLITTHDLAGVEGIADRVGIIKDARLVIDEELETLKVRYPHSLEEIFTTVVGEESSAAAGGAK
jgi:ABC-2 type transport system ATP-binding protein